MSNTKLQTYGYSNLKEVVVKDCVSINNGKYAGYIGVVEAKTQRSAKVRLLGGSEIITCHYYDLEYRNRNNSQK